MIKLIAGKVALALITLAFVLTFNFFLFRAVGDPRNDLLRVPHMSEVQREHLIHARGLDRSLLDQYGIYVRNTLQRAARDELPLGPARHRRDRRGPAEHADPGASPRRCSRRCSAPGSASSRRAGAGARATAG